MGNLDYGCVEGDLDSLFEGLAIEKRTLVVDKETGESRGYGYVDFKDEESFQRALERDKASLLGELFSTVSHRKINYTFRSTSECKHST